MKIYNGEGMILGRLAAEVAKQVLQGEDVVVINCEKTFISGKKAVVIGQEKAKRLRKGYPLKAAKFSRLPDRAARRTIRGMLPWRTARGQEAFRHVMCHVGVPAEYQGKASISIPTASYKKLPNLNYITLGEVCKSLGGKQ